MLPAILLTLIGSADLVRSGFHSTSVRLVLIGLSWIAVVTVAMFGLGVPVWCVGITVALASAWVFTTTTISDRRMATGILPVVGVVLSIISFLVWDRTALDLKGFVVEWHDGAVSSVLAAVPLPAIALSLGVALFAIESANLAVRVALRPATAASRPVAVPVSAPRWWKHPARTPVVEDLRGGRLIGPVERLLIITLTLAGAFPVVAGLLAAKGIVRFPEISRDGATGSKAEYFLVGSLASWAVALAGAGLIWIAAKS